jgi:hypothetical protein
MGGELLFLDSGSFASIIGSLKMRQVSFNKFLVHTISTALAYLAKPFGFFMGSALILPVGVSLVISLGAPSPAFSLDAASQEALKNTKELLRNQNLRNESMKNDPKARELDANLNKYFGGDTEKLYDMSADLMDRLVNESGGDSIKMQELVQGYAKNPAALLKSLTPSQQSQIRGIASEIESKNANKSAVPSRK